MHRENLIHQLQRKSKHPQQYLHEQNIFRHHCANFIQLIIHCRFKLTTFFALNDFLYRN